VHTHAFVHVQTGIHTRGMQNCCPRVNTPDAASISLRVFLPGAPRTFMSRIAFQHSCTMSEGAWADVSGIDGAGPFSETRTHEAPRRAVTHLAVFDGHVLKDEGQLELIQQQQAPPLIPGHPRTRTRQHSHAVRDMLPRAHARRPPLTLLAVPPPPRTCGVLDGGGGGLPGHLDGGALAPPMHTPSCTHAWPAHAGARGCPRAARSLT
jgi:hypothetical protein